MLKWFVKNINNRKGFTLVELVVVIAILGILSAIAVPRFTGTQENAREKADEATLATVQSAVRLCEAETGKLPGASGGTSVNDFITNYMGGSIPHPTANKYKSDAKAMGISMDSNGVVRYEAAPSGTVILAAES